MNQKIYEILIYVALRKHILQPIMKLLRVADSSVCLAQSTVIGRSYFNNF
jgi:hypothetical protein